MLSDVVVKNTNPVSVPSILWKWKHTTQTEIYFTVSNPMAFPVRSLRVTTIRATLSPGPSVNAAPNTFMNIISEYYTLPNMSFLAHERSIATHRPGCTQSNYTHNKNSFQFPPLSPTPHGLLSHHHRCVKYEYLSSLPAQNATLLPNTHGFNR